MEYVNHSGGCKGADLEWDRIGKELGFNNHIHYRPSDLKYAPLDVKRQIESDVYKAALALGRPVQEFPGKDLVRRNWFQANRAEAIYAISRIVRPNELDKGFVNHTGRELVAGGTGWAVQMGIQMKKDIHVLIFPLENGICGLERYSKRRTLQS